MARINRIPLTLAALSVFVSAHANALGLGEITLHSALNQPLDAEIALLQTGDMTSDELIAHLASPAAFEQAGVERFMFLQNLHFTPVIRGGRSYIKVVSTQPVHEPYLNFLVEVERPNGRLLREYTVLLDPPSYSSAHSSVAASIPAVDRGTSGRRTAAVRSAPSAPPIPAGEGRYTTVRNDTLWSIASRMSGTGASRTALMDSLLALNPQAFVNGDPHRLKVGQTLVLPQGQQLAGVTAAPAPAPVLERPAPAAPGTPEVAQVENDLAQANAQRDQLNQRMDEMQRQLENLRKALDNRDQQVQSLQAELARRASTATPESPAAVTATPAASKAGQPAPSQPAAVVAAPATPSSDAMNTQFSLWPWLAVGAAGALLVGLLLMRRKRTEEPLENTGVRLAASKPMPPAKPLAAAVAVPLAAPRPVVVSTPEPGVARLPAASPDSLEGADIYIAYGRFSQARDMLRKAVAQEPNRRELRSKLLLVLAELGDVAGFHEQERELVAIGGDQKQIDQIKSRYPAMLVRPEDTPSGPTSETLTDWDDLELGDTPAPVEKPAAPETQPDFALNLSEMSLDLDWDALDNPFEAPQRSKNAALAEQPMPADFRSNLHELPEITELDLDGEHAGMFGKAKEDDLVFDLPESSGHEHDELLASLDEARACIDRGNLDEAYRILKQVIENGDSKAKAEARELLALIA
ncbi:LysM peptidoglycan-binding domain-containing protein [Pseudomonas sp. ZM23]|uniref:LysM peptidoglycan-binding domain-containing protein n=1 Tax=Pseudomonas triclosanedens TaxID=2961893 RepID=A0ABY7A2J9_9PSED|nr:FimV/HubP family polar landmark protein [Pseudomonas triclosanedens]MCP8464731.1 LysM peptidoglycan-binding domain-containing protein [Pseudomonas triclosanedens]MCP8470556.1 LysM peptidoglycan-binding domain-containing protein [Pseudomonas triclosanedens]MCP8476362.1 LysM peptidoglycan-binding domain-containing protein [Pseudomonas triclosanedens]WAI51411.1 LysM peptidoglycan-binding domain-containing protein [Pseudomonas triclosanedens]